MSVTEFDPLDEVSVTLAELCFCMLFYFICNVVNKNEVGKVFATFKKYSDPYIFYILYYFNGIVKQKKWILKDSSD